MELSRSMSEYRWIFLAIQGKQGTQVRLVAPFENLHCVPQVASPQSLDTND